MSPRFGLIALAVLETAQACDDERVEVSVGGESVSATVAPLAIYDPGKLRPRA
jgi:glycine cleavage system aminomethyltransferase T